MHFSARTTGIFIATLAAVQPSSAVPVNNYDNGVLAKKGIHLGPPSAETLASLAGPEDGPATKRGIKLNQLPSANTLAELGSSDSGAVTKRDDKDDEGDGSADIPLSTKSLEALKKQNMEFGSMEKLTDEQLKQLLKKPGWKRDIVSAPIARSVNYGLDHLSEDIKRDILKAENEALKEAREANSWSNYFRRSFGIDKRDKRKDCGKGNGVWVNVAQWKNDYSQFCSMATGPDVAVRAGTGSGTSSNDDPAQAVGWITFTMNTTLSQQNEDLRKKGVDGPQGWIECKYHVSIYLSIDANVKPVYAKNYHRKDKNGFGFMTYEECTDWEQKQANTNSKCYGKNHQDTKGGTWLVDSWGLIGGKIYKYDGSKSPDWNHDETR